jgi:hypothetical protein
MCFTGRLHVRHIFAPDVSAIPHPVRIPSPVVRRVKFTARTFAIRLPASHAPPLNVAGEDCLSDRFLIFIFPSHARTLFQPSIFFRACSYNFIIVLRHVIIFYMIRITRIKRI